MFHTEVLGTAFTFDLHVLGTPPAFILSQDQTLRKEFHPELTEAILSVLSLFSC